MKSKRHFKDAATLAILPLGFAETSEQGAYYFEKEIEETTIPHGLSVAFLPDFEKKQRPYLFINKKGIRLTLDLGLGYYRIKKGTVFKPGDKVTVEIFLCPRGKAVAGLFVEKTTT